MILQRDGPLLCMLLVLRRAIEWCIPLQLKMIQNQDTVMKGSDVGWRFESTIFVEAGCCPEDIVSVPFPRLAHHVSHRRRLFVNCARLAIKVGFVLIGIEYLELIHSHQENAAVPTPLSVSFDDCRSRPFHVHLAITKRIHAGNHPFPGNQRTVHDGPFVTILPSGQVFSIKKNNRVGWR